jgi:predicted amidohydrolase YtcJ
VNPQPAQSATLALPIFFHNCEVFTPEALARGKPPARSIEFVCGIVVSIGQSKPSAPCARRVNLRGALVFPGFIDAHTHLASYGASLKDLRLNDLPSAEDVYIRVNEAAQRTPPGEWILGRGWDESRWTPPLPLSAKRLSDICPQHPVFLLRVDGHIGLLNDAGFHRLGLDPRRYSDGALRESELDAARAAFRAPPENRAADILRAAQEALSLGITSIHEMAHTEDLHAYRHLWRESRLPLRVYLIPYYSAWRRALDEGLLPSTTDRWLWSRGVKFFADGSLGARTALLSEDYADAPGHRGRHYEDPEFTATGIAEVLSSGYQPVIHCIGDSAIDWALTTLERATTVSSETRPRLEHFELPTDDHIRRLKALGGIASMQPNFTGQWGFPGSLYEQRLGPARLSRMNPLWNLHHRKVPMCFGSDSMPMSPVFGIRSAVSPPFRSQQIKPRDATRYHTAGGAFASFAEDWLGVLAPGFLADLVVMTAMPDEMGKILATVVAGNLAFSLSDSPVIPDHFLP